METYLMITQINDFTFCPRSIYFHDVYRNSVGEDAYHAVPQKVGRASHKAIDEGSYSSRKDVLTGAMVYSSRYGLMGRIDIFYVQTGLLVERKYSVTAVWPGFRYQLYAQSAALLEMGYTVRALRIHSAKDNKNYDVQMPGEAEKKEFEELLYRIRHFSLSDQFTVNPKKCRSCIYRELCDLCPEGDEA